MWAAYDAIVATDLTNTKNTCEGCNKFISNFDDVHTLPGIVAHMTYHRSCGLDHLRQFKMTTCIMVPDPTCDCCWKCLSKDEPCYSKPTGDWYHNFIFCSTCFWIVRLTQVHQLGRQWLRSIVNFALWNVQPVPQRKILPEWNITAERNTLFAQLFSKVVLNHHPGSILELCLITDFEGDLLLGHADTVTAIAVGCIPNKHPVYSVLRYRRNETESVVINFLYASFAEYATALAAWTNTSTPAERVANHTRALQDGVDSEEDEVAAYLTFAVFIRHQKKLPFSYYRV